MIARAPYLFLLLIIIPDLYLDLHYWRHRFGKGWTAKRLLYWMPTLGMIAYTLYLMYEKNFIPDNSTILYIYLFLLGFIIIPKWIFMLCSITGLGACRLFHKKKNYGNLVGLLLVPVIWFILIYGSTIGFQKLEVNHQTYASPELPAAFDGYRIVLFSDAHVGSYKGSQQRILQKAIDSINAQHPDLIVYAGDLQNIQPQELYEHMDILSQLKAKDGIYSVLGNHDYAKYIDCNEARKVANLRETVSLEKQLGWTLLRNEHRTLTKGKDHIIIAGMENDGNGITFPQYGNISKTLKSVKDDDFILMLEHDPSCWRRKIIPDGRAQLTLSGHTHKMQFTIFGWCPMTVTGKEVNGWYTEGKQSLFVTAGLGGLIPFRFGATGEIVVLTLKKSK
ncbi:MAG: metallophosphoesterase family protein [Prevotella sp.]|nr:metallophosphoesterase family protein [Prevotella sp.]